ncbi:6-phosphofructokinase [Candidatus Aerophobetes bacterium]|nr:6-phosphofructokinase [Candidatus Aerophobetes bacterium]
MNPCIRGVVRAATQEELEVVGIRRGYAGLIEQDIQPMDASSVSGIICQGGTILKTARSDYFMQQEGQRKAVDNIRKMGIDALVVIGGDGSFKGAKMLDEVWGVPTVGIPATIDNDIWGTDFTIGFMSAVNTALEAIDKIRDTATSHNRLFLIEVMGRTSGFIALWAGVAGGAEDIVIPEIPTNLDSICAKLEEGRRRGKTSSIMVVAEGDEAGNAFEIASKIEQTIHYEVRVAVLGHMQRGGAPGVWDRILGMKLGKGAVDVICEGKRNVMVGLVNGKIKVSPIEDSWKRKKEIDLELYRLNQIMAT